MELRLQVDNPTTGVMADPTTQNGPAKPRDFAFTGTLQKKTARSAFFKYYIHDGVESCRLQLFGEFTETQVTDLMGCWNTVKTTLGSRQFVLDVREMRAVDEVAKRWLIEMAAEGAVFIPETYLRDGLAGDSYRSEASTRGGLVSRLVALFRGSPATEA